MDEPPQSGPGDVGLSAAAAREARLAALRAAAQRGLDDIKAGRVIDLDEALDRIEAMLDEMEAVKRA
jgi:predicted transcriptional regulator